MFAQKYSNYFPFRSFFLFFFLSLCFFIFFCTKWCVIYINTLIIKTKKNFKGSVNILCKDLQCDNFNFYHFVKWVVVFPVIVMGAYFGVRLLGKASETGTYGFYYIFFFVFFLPFFVCACCKAYYGSFFLFVFLY